MINYGYNRLSAKGMSYRRLLRARYNEASKGLDPNEPSAMEQRVTPATLMCRVDGGHFIIPDNTSSIQRPMFRVQGFLERAWGAFHGYEDGRVIDQVVLAHDNQEVMVCYTHPISDDTLKICIDAGMYRDERFEEVMNRLLLEENFDIQHDVTYEFMEAPFEVDGVTDLQPVILLDAHDIHATEAELYDKSSVDDMLKRAALIAIDLAQQGVKSETLADYKKVEQEPVIAGSFSDVVKTTETMQQSEEQSYIEQSSVLPEPVDLTDQLRDVVQFNASSEDERLLRIKRDAQNKVLPTLAKHEERIEEERRKRLEAEQKRASNVENDEGLDV